MPRGREVKPKRPKKKTNFAERNIIKEDETSRRRRRANVTVGRKPSVVRRTHGRFRKRRKEEKEKWRPIKRP
ncbi:hypothetical protein TNIN_27781 [Trichonephila inaurata madagascariensis]|uniref:Uncharacterized protein n=1 Tax=Trichonephila inaurata madagascariensis TaxID=2747483 RepID=A0A8X6YG11_9ARAC|nr:hypothetical protein TNIN_27781 [Trichonephila inaurata madagascariensis]